MLQATLPAFLTGPTTKGPYTHRIGPWGPWSHISQDDGESVVAYVVLCTCPVLTIDYISFAGMN